jgi:hypothetical protein
MLDINKNPLKFYYDTKLFLLDLAALHVDVDGIGFVPSSFICHLCVCFLTPTA